MAALDPIPIREAARILGCTTVAVRHHLAEGRLQHTADRRGTVSRADAERLAAETYLWFRAARDVDPESYWVTGSAAAAVLGVNRARLGQLADEGRLPFLRHRDGTRLYRRDQLAIIANARAAKPRTGIRTW